MNDFQIVKAHPQLLSFVDGLQRRNAEALSFYPKCVFEREAEKGRILLGLLNGEPAGYLYVGARKEDVKCHQVCIQYDARRKLYGAALVQAMEDYAQGSYSITLRCGFDLDANAFWSEMGYDCIGIQNGGVRRMRKINVWRKSLKAELFKDVFMTPSSGKTDASVWRKHRQTGIVTQFVRGRTLRDYRAVIMAKQNTPMKTLKLSGGFEASRSIADAFDEMESARNAMANEEYGSESYFEALKAFKAAEERWTQARKIMKASK